MKIEEWLGEDNKLGQDIWNGKYRYKKESFDEWLNRVSGGDEGVKEAIKAKKFLFGGRVLSNRGVTDSKVSLSNCYVITPPEDNIESIYETMQKMARTYSYGGGVGIDISKLAPEGAKVANQAKTSSGAVSFMSAFSNVSETIGQNGRRGALMISMSCDHPDIEKFIDSKTNDNAITKANISVRVTDDFMKAVEEDRDWVMSFTRPESGETISRTVKAKYLFNKLCENNWNWAEPGILYWDTIKSYNLLNNNVNFEYAGVNPCAEEPLPAGGSCSLCSINLSEFVKNSNFDYDDFKNTVKLAVRAQNAVLDEGLTLHPLTEQKWSVADWRQIGVGVFGIADMLIKLGLKYDTDEAIKFCDELGFMLADTAIATSAELAKEFGTYPRYTADVLDTTFFKNNTTTKTRELVKQFGLRNSQLLTIAPTGTLSNLIGVSGGIEPIFANYYTRKTQSLYGEDVYYKVYTPIVKKYMEDNNIEDDKNLPNYFVTAQNMDPFMRVKMQATWQKHIDASISSTVNLPNEATVDEVYKLYISAWKNGLKGMTIYRDGCARSGVLTTDNTKKAETTTVESTTIPRGFIIDCSDDLVGKKRKIQTGCGSLHILAWFDPITGELQETYIAKGSTGGCLSNLTAIGRLISLSCRAGVPIENVIDQLSSSLTCPSYTLRANTKKDTSKGSSCPAAIGNALLEMYKEFQKELNDDCDEDEYEEPTTGEKCPKCGATLVYRGGCKDCPECGWSKCD